VVDRLILSVLYRSQSHQSFTSAHRSASDTSPISRRASLDGPHSIGNTSRLRWRDSNRILNHGVNYQFQKSRIQLYGLTQQRRTIFGDLLPWRFRDGKVGSGPTRGVWTAEVQKSETPNRERIGEIHALCSLETWLTSGVLRSSKVA
jgi:hypothetical protein